MIKKVKQGEFVEKEKVYVMPARKGEELHFSIVELEGKIKADIRFFSKIDEGMRPTYRGIVIDPPKMESVVEGAQKLMAAISK